MTLEFCVSFSEGEASAVYDVWMGPWKPFAGTGLVGKHLMVLSLLATSCRQLLNVPEWKLSGCLRPGINCISNISLLLDSRIFKPKQLRILDGRYLYSRLWFITKAERSWIQTSQGLQDRCSHHSCCMYGHSSHCSAHLHDEVLNLWTQRYLPFTTSAAFFWISKAHPSVATVCWNREKKISDAFLQCWRLSSESIYSRKKST